MKCERCFWTLAFVLSLTISGRASRADETVVPVPLQADLIAKIAAFDRNFAARVGDNVVVLIVTAPGNGESARVGAQLQRALNSKPVLGGRAHTETIFRFSDATGLATACRAQHVAIVYLGPGLGDVMPAIASALRGVNVLSVTGVPDYVDKGVVLGFDLEEGKPKMLVKLAQARAQSVAFRAEVLKMMKVTE